jgi:hypothetical protein
VSPDLLALHDDLARISEVLDSAPGDPQAADYVAQFLSGIARIAHDDGMQDAAAELARHRASGKPFAGDIDRIAGLVQNRLQHRKAV